MIGILLQMLRFNDTGTRAVSTAVVGWHCYAVYGKLIDADNIELRISNYGSTTDPKTMEAWLAGQDVSLTA